MEVFTHGVGWASERTTVKMVVWTYARCVFVELSRIIFLDPRLKNGAETLL